jgi:hypothetical protein
MVQDVISKQLNDAVKAVKSQQNNTRGDLPKLGRPLKKNIMVKVIVKFMILIFR